MKPRMDFVVRLLRSTPSRYVTMRLCIRTSSTGTITTCKKNYNNQLTSQLLRGSCNIPWFTRVAIGSPCIKYVKMTSSLACGPNQILSRKLPPLFSGCMQYSRYVEGQVPPDIRLKPPWRVLFFGTDDYAKHHLKALNENRLAGDRKVLENLEVVVPLMKCAVGKHAEESGLKSHIWPIPTMQGAFDVGVVVSFGYLIPKRVIRMFPYGILNVHPSVLPRWRGASPIIHTILNGDQETGISIMEIRPEHFDVGPLLLQVRFAVPNDCTTFQLRNALAHHGKHLLIETLQNLPTLERFEQEQPEEGITYAHKLSPVNAKVNWTLQTPEHIDRQFRALSEMRNFQLRSEWNGHVVRLLDMVPLDVMKNEVESLIRLTYPENQVSPRPGLPFFHKHKKVLCIRCRNGWVGFQRIVLKKAITAKDFYNGYLSKSDKGICFKSEENELDKYTFRTSIATQKLDPLPYYIKATGT